jgi:hypothetical protein
MGRNWGKYVFRVIAILVIVLFAVTAIMELLIGSGVKSSIQAAQAHFPGKRVEALMAMVECESCSLEDRNQAVWALGQLDDRRALPVLEKYYTGKPCNHRLEMCQPKLRIALRHLRHQDKNRFEAFLWRWMLPAES